MLFCVAMGKSYYISPFFTTFFQFFTTLISFCNDRNGIQGISFCTDSGTSFRNGIKNGNQGRFRNILCADIQDCYSGNALCSDARNGIRNSIRNGICSDTMNVIQKRHFFVLIQWTSFRECPFAPIQGTVSGMVSGDIQECPLYR